MQLVPLSTDGRVTAVNSTSSARGPLRVVLEPHGDEVGVVAVGPGIRRLQGRLAPDDASAYAPVLRRLRAQGLAGTCPARLTPSGALVLDLAPAHDCLLGNGSGGLVLLAAERTVTVTREEHHQDVLAGRSGRVAVALRPCPIAAGKYAGQRGIEVTLDGRRVGELTRLMSQRYLPMIEDVAARGRTAGCEALLGQDRRGAQVELRLPAVAEEVRPDGAAPTSPVPPVRTDEAGTSPAGWRTAVVVPTRPDPVAAGSTDRAAVTTIEQVPTAWRPPDPTVAAPPAGPDLAAVAPVPPLRPSLIDHCEPGPRRARRRVVWAGAAVVGVLVFAAAVGNGGRSESPAAVVPAVPASSSPTLSSPSSSSPAPTGTAVAADDTGDQTGGAVVAPAPRTPARAAKPAAPSRSTTRSVPPKLAPTTAASAVQPKPAPKPAAKPASGCDSNYSGCVPVASDVDCEGGSGDGPAYVRGPVRVIGKDVYGLDRGGAPGVGCE